MSANRPSLRVRPYSSVGVGDATEPVRAKPLTSGPPDYAGGVTRRALALSCLLLLLLAVATFYVDFYGVPAMPPVVVALLLALVAGSRPLRRFALTRREILTIYSLLLVGGPLMGHGILFWMLPKVISWYYLARATPRWEALLLHQIPTWFSPTSESAATSFFEGQAVVPWALWLTPLAAWGSFLLALFVASVCLVAIFQRQWISGERLTFPLARIPLSIVVESDEARSSVGRAAAMAGFWWGSARPR